MNAVLLGSPGVGKGTCAKILSEKTGLPHISTGDMLRQAIREGTALGREAKSFVDAGKLVPDGLVTKMVQERLSQPDCKKGFLLDGYPRTVAQARDLEGFMAVGVVLNLSAPESVIVERLSGRRTCRGCSATYHVKNSPPKKEGVCDRCSGELYQRSDEKPEVVAERLKVYEKQTKPLVEFYRGKGILADINAGFGMPEISKVIGQCEDAIKAAVRRK
ncbi:adenylate kinase [Candidatus Woesearchaeota archaeon]|nr:adenylate kinase [Candidatus Woesearchaeota archaeon]